MPALSGRSRPAVLHSDPLDGTPNPQKPLTGDSSSCSSATSFQASSPSESTSSSPGLPRFNHSPPPKRIPYPYTTSFKLRSTLRPRRNSATPFVAVLRRRIVHLLILLSIPIFGLLLRSELNHQALIRTRSTSSHIQQFELQNLETTPVNLSSLRREHEHLLRRELSWQSASGRAKRGWRDYAGVEELSGEYLEDPGIESAIKEEVFDLWPAWWGSSDEVGKSPFDYEPGSPPKEKWRVMFLTDYIDYLERMNTHTYEIVDAAIRHPHTTVDVWGPGWAGYDRSVPLSTNIRRRQRRLEQLAIAKAEFEADQEERRKEVGRQNRWARWTTKPLEVFVEKHFVAPPWPDWATEEDTCGDENFDIVWTISDIFKQDDPHVDVLDCGTMLVQQLGDCHELRCMNEWYPQANNITLSKYAFELQEIFAYDNVKRRFPSWEMGIFGHSPDTGNEWDYWPVSWAKKTAQASVFGFDGSFYPIRTTVTDYLWTESPTLITRHPHPGYTLDMPDEARDHPLETYTPNHELYQNHLSLRADFARGMREAKICVFDASLERKLIRKYAQALLSGCVIAADLPTEHEEALERFTIPLKPSWGIEKIHAEIERYLAMPEKLHQMSMDGFIYARRHLTTTRKVSDVLDMAQAYREGVRGYSYPHSWSSRCRAYWSGDSWRPAWCSPERGFRDLED
ncbi:hypothetical protein BCR39DRAFT_461978 [Naematelia encephala]|uniref:Uncharacterized protein n=1 Tax=Naematelia encephala TaxID=71784 RepID=A0A1Y2BJ53_9TREE|nr:hypothetical protein BCR39DRAFT_461978 [Naematelia encephala]